jgi:hypothetical protein
LPEIRSGTENKMLETNCPDEKTEPVRCQWCERHGALSGFGLFPG